MQHLFGTAGIRQRFIRDQHGFDRAGLADDQFGVIPYPHFDLGRRIEIEHGLGRHIGIIGSRRRNRRGRRGWNDGISRGTRIARIARIIVRRRIAVVLGRVGTRRQSEHRGDNNHGYFGFIEKSIFFHVKTPFKQ
ncbi:hypothetical protein D3C79_660350 [compost metagenome]